MPSIPLAVFFGRKIDFLGSNQNVNLGVNGDYPIFTTGTVINRAPTGVTYIAFVTVTPNVYRAGWDAATSGIQLDSGNWGASASLSGFTDIPSIVYPGEGAVAAPYYANNIVFNLNVIITNAANGIATVAAYGWAY